MPSFSWSEYGPELVIHDVLEHVGVQRAFGQRVVRLHVVVEFHDLDLVALFFQDRLDAQLQLVRIRAGAGADDEFFRVLGVGGGGEGQAGCGQEQGAANVVHAFPCTEILKMN